MSTPPHPPSERPSLPVRGGLAIALAVILNVVIVLGANALGIAPEFRAVSIPPVAFLSALGAAGATVVYWLAHRHVADVERTFLQIAVAVLLLSFVPDLALLRLDPDATPVAVVVLMRMYVVAAVSVGLLVYWRRGQ